MLGITVVPFLSTNGEPCARVTITGTTTDGATKVDANGAEIAIQYTGGEYLVMDYRGADATE